MANIMGTTEPYYLAPVICQTKENIFIKIRELKKYHIGMYQFDKGEIFSFKTDNGKIPNNLDGGPDFWPAGSDGDQLIYGMILPVNLLNPDKEKPASVLEIKDSKAALAYQKLLRTIKEDDNPIVMVVKI